MYSLYEEDELSPEALLYFEDECIHSWVVCSHQNKGPGSFVLCKLLPEYRTFTHKVCERCGREQFSNKWLELIEKKIIPRLAGALKIQIVFRINRPGSKRVSYHRITAPGAD